MKPLINPVPASFFGIALGSLALANAWRVGVSVFHLPEEIASVLTFVALIVWVGLLSGFAYTWLQHRAIARAEFENPVQAAYISLIPTSSMLAAAIILPSSRELAIGIYVIAAIASLLLGARHYSRIWKGHLEAAQVTPVSYLPGVAPNLVAGGVAAAFGWHQLGGLFFGAGMLSWFAIESMILNRSAAHAELDAKVRPGLGIQLAPPVVAGGAYLSLTTGSPDLFAYALLGYGLYQVATMAKLFPWISRQPFAPGYWGFSFGLAALPTMAMRLMERGAAGSVEWIAIATFIGANVAIGVLVARTIGLVLEGKLLPTPALPAAAR